MSDRITYLINNLTESPAVEVKNWLNGLQTNDDRARLAKEIIALANNGGGDIFIGFEDKGAGHPEIRPRPGEVEAFSQDGISGLIDRYVNPPFQCRIGLHKREGGEILHPVITVPGDHRTPVMAKRGSPDQRTLRTGTVYVRRPGGSSEPASTQDDWERLLDRLVRARRDEMLDAVRDVLNPPESIAAPSSDLNSWDEESRKLWQHRVDRLPAGDPRRLEAGHWSVSFAISPFREPSIVELNDALAREMPAYSGWPPFTYLHSEPKKPKPAGDTIIAWLVNPDRPLNESPYGTRADFWRVARSGHGYLLNEYQEDAGIYDNDRQSSPVQRDFDWTLPIYRMTEILKFVEALAKRFGEAKADFRVLLRYFGTRNRTLSYHSFEHPPPPSGTCMQSTLESQVGGTVSDLEILLPELVHALLAPIYQQFDFAELPQALVNDEVRGALGYGQR